MKILKKIILVIVALIGLCFLFRGFIYRHFVKYQSIGVRTNYTATNQKLIDYIEANAGHEENPDAKKVIKLALSITSKQLRFTTGRNSNDPNVLIDTKTANCIGYAAFFSATCNYLFKKYGLTGWYADPQVGQLYLLGTNIHKYFSSPFLKDHDFVIIFDKNTVSFMAVDPTLNDYLWIDFVTLK